MLSRVALFARCWLRREVIFRALRVASFVTPVLIIINHYDAILSLQFDGLLQKVLTTFCVPYCVSSYSSAMTLYVNLTSPRAGLDVAAPRDPSPKTTEASEHKAAA